MALDDILLETEDKMIKSVGVVEKEFSQIHTGRASASLVENIHVEAYGSNMRLREVAGITTPEARLIVVQPWDTSVVQAVEKGILKANLGFTPVVDGKIIRIRLPDLSTERRQELVKVVKKMSEEGRVAIRSIRREAIEEAKKLQKDGEISEDDLKGAEKEIQALTDKYSGQIDGHLAKKEKEITTV